MGQALLGSRSLKYSDLVPTSVRFRAAGRGLGGGHVTQTAGASMTSELCMTSRTARTIPYSITALLPWMPPAATWDTPRTRAQWGPARTADRAPRAMRNPKTDS